ncbi:MAG: hypothetical protein FJY17_09070 [Bacteroidetes bacterium]|nr:hypothetical protein [Bacteroidota bacterium]
MRNYIFIDFEGKMNSLPSFVGILFAGEFRQIVLTDTLLGCVGPTKVTYQPLKEFLQETLDLAEKHQTKICAFSTLERDVFVEQGYQEIENYYCNAHKVLKKWFNVNQHNNRPRPFSLSNVLLFFQYPLVSYGYQKASKRIKDMEDALRIHKQNYANVTHVVKAKWTKVLNYNKQDVEGMKFALERIHI